MSKNKILNSFLPVFGISYIIFLISYILLLSNQTLNILGIYFFIYPGFICVLVLKIYNEAISIYNSIYILTIFSILIAALIGFFLANINGFTKIILASMYYGITTLLIMIKSKYLYSVLSKEMNIKHLKTFWKTQLKDSKRAKYLSTTFIILVLLSSFISIALLPNKRFISVDAWLYKINGSEISFTTTSNLTYIEVFGNLTSIQLGIDNPNEIEILINTTVYINGTVAKNDSYILPGKNLFILNSTITTDLDAYYLINFKLFIIEREIEIELSLLLLRIIL